MVMRMGERVGCSSSQSREISSYGMLTWQKGGALPIRGQRGKKGVMKQCPGLVGGQYKEESGTAVLGGVGREGEEIRMWQRGKPLTSVQWCNWTGDGNRADRRSHTRHCSGINGQRR